MASSPRLGSLDRFPARAHFLRMRRKRRDKGLEKAIQAAGGITALAELLGVTKQAVAQWDRVPIDSAKLVESATGVPRIELRPDIFS